MFFITAGLHASGNLAYVLLGTSRQQNWTSAPSDGDVNTPSVGAAAADVDENAPLVVDSVPSRRTYGTVDDVVS